MSGTEPSRTLRESNDLPPRRLRTSLGTRLAVASIVLLVVGPILWTGVPRELSRWYVAAAEEADLQGDETAVGRNLDQALRWNPEQPDALSQRAVIRLDAGDVTGALKDANQAVDLEGSRGISSRMRRVLINQRLGNHDEVFQDIEKIVQVYSGYPDQFPTALNLRAYARALANRDLELGLKDITKAIELTAADQPSASLALRAAFLDTRGYLYYLLGQVTEAVSDLEQAAQAEEARWEKARKSSEGTKRGPTPKEEQEHRETMAVIYHHRGLAYKKAGRSEEATKDLQRAQELGYDPQKGVW